MICILFKANTVNSSKLVMIIQASLAFTLSFTTLRPFMYHSIRQYQHSTRSPSLSPSPFAIEGNPIKVTDSLLIILRIIQSTVSQCAIRATMVVFLGLLTAKHQSTFRQNFVMLVTAKSQRRRIPKCLYTALFRAGLFSI